jgi:hypothetical protein
MPHRNYVFDYGLLIGLLLALPCLAQTHHSGQTRTSAALKKVLKQYLKEQDVEDDDSTRRIGKSKFRA